MELIRKDKKLSELNEEGKISVRIVNALRYYKMITIGDVVDYINKGNDLKRFKNLGRKSEYELLDFLSGTRFVDGGNITSGEEEKLQKNASKELELFEDCIRTIKCSNEKVASYISEKTSDIPSFCLWLNGHTNGIVATIETFSREENIIFRQYLVNILDKHIELMKSYSDNSLADAISRTDAIRNLISTNVGHFSYYDEFCFLSPLLKANIERRYHNLCENKLNVRAVHLFEKYGVSLTDLIKLFDKPLEDYSRLCPGTYNRKTLSEIYLFNQEFKELFEKSIRLTDIEIRELEIKSDFPYLSFNQRHFVTDFISANGYRPLLYLLYNYLRISEDKEDKLYSFFHGFFDGCPHTRKELAGAFNLTIERVRQILYCEIPAVNKIRVTEEEKAHYCKIFSSPILTEISAEVSSQMEVEHLNCSFSVFAALVRLITDFEIYSPYRSLETLVNESSIDKRELKSSILLLEKVARGKHSKDTEFNLNDIITCGDSLRPYLVNFLSYIALAEFGINVDKKGHFTMSQNCVDIEEELYEILLCHDKALHIEELFCYFKKKYPNHKYTEPAQLRYYLIRSNRIGSIGKTSTYALKDQSGIFFGSIRDLIYSILDSADEPVEVTLLTKKVKTSYPKTSQSSIESSMQSDSLNRFVAFKGGFYGLTSKTYIGNWKKAQQSYHRLPFEERIKNYADFVETYHRLPSSSANNDEEAALGRWKQNVEYSILVLTNEQRTQFDDMLQVFLEKGYPRTLHESNFLVSCHEYKDFVYSQHKLPTLKQGRELFEWFRRSLSNYDGYADQRYNYFTDLLTFITSLGFEINQGKNKEE